MGRGVVLVSMVAVILSFTYGSGPAMAATGQAAEKPVTVGIHKEIILNIPAHIIRYLENGQLVKEYPIAVGKPASPTPEGKFRIINKLVHPTWYPPDGGEPVPPGPANPLGHRWLGFAPGFGIHGTNAPASIGGAVSLGCVRMYNRDVEELYSRLPVGTPVQIIYQTLECHWEPEEGRFALVLHPDVYGRGLNTPKYLRQQLQDLELGDAWSEEILTDLIERSKLGPVAVAHPSVAITLNGKPIDFDIRREGEGILLPLRPLAEEMGFQVSWDPQQGPLLEGEVVAEGIIIDGATYLTLPDLRELLGVKAGWQAREYCLDIYRITATYDGRFLTDEIIREGGELFVAAQYLTREWGIPYRWEPGEGLVCLLEKKIRGIEREGELYLSVASLAEQLGPECGLGVEWAEETYELQLYDLPEAGQDDRPQDVLAEGSRYRQEIQGLSAKFLFNSGQNRGDDRNADPSLVYQYP